MPKPTKKTFHLQESKMTKNAVFFDFFSKRRISRKHEPKSELISCLGTPFSKKCLFWTFVRVFRDPPLLGVEKSTFWDNSLIKELFHPPDPANMPLFEARETALLAPKSEKRAKTGPFLSDFVANRAIFFDPVFRQKWQKGAPPESARGPPKTAIWSHFPQESHVK